jgi:integrase/recombinase XerD
MLATWLTSYLHAKQHTCTPSTLATYRAYVGAWVQWTAATQRAVDASSISAYLLTLRERGTAPATQYTAYRHIKAFVRWLLDEEQSIVATDPFAGKHRVKPPKRRRVHRPVYGEIDLVALLQCPLPSPRRNQSYAALLADHTQTQLIVLLLADTGLRNKEAASLTVAQLEREQLIIVGKGGHEDVAPISPVVKDLLLRWARAWERTGTDPVFLDQCGQPLRPATLRNALHRLAARAKVALPPRPVHAFRHYAARAWLAAGLTEGMVQSLMRHVEASTTRIYTEGGDTVLRQRWHQTASATPALLARLAAPVQQE